MTHTVTVDAIILKSYDVGEADRYCILLTKERGRIAARARSVRKLGSKMGGSLLPLQQCALQLREGSAGYMITDAQRVETTNDVIDSDAFASAQQGIELLLNTVHDEEPMEDLFKSTQQFLAMCTRNPRNAVLPFTIQLLDILGLLPDTTNAFFQQYSEAQKHFIQLSVDGDWHGLPDLTAKEKQMFSVACSALLSEISSRPLKAGSVLNDMQSMQSL